MVKRQVRVAVGAGGAPAALQSEAPYVSYWLPVTRRRSALDSGRVLRRPHSASMPFARSPKCAEPRARGTDLGPRAAYDALGVVVPCPSIQLPSAAGRQRGGRGTAASGYAQGIIVKLATIGQEPTLVLVKERLRRRVIDQNGNKDG